MSTRSLAEPTGASSLRSVLNRPERWALPVAALGAVLLLACSSAPKPERLSPQTMSSTPPPPAENLPGPDPRELPAPVAESDGAGSGEGTGSPLTVVIEDGADRAGRPLSLVEAAAAERARRANAGPSIAVVTDKNLAEFQSGQLTEMRAAQEQQPAAAPTAPPESSDAVAVPTQAELTATRDPETYWRGRVLRARMNWAAAVEETRHLESKIAELRQRFYAEDDPYYRDSQIKPSWDRALDRLGEAKAAIEQYSGEVQSILEEGRRASALPGWLREGIDLEPGASNLEREGTPAPGEYRPGEPQVAQDPDGRRK